MRSLHLEGLWTKLIIESVQSKFSNKGHILASVGAAVGIANLVLFPARMSNFGGMAFVLVFLVCTFLLGLPLMMGETALGRNGKTDPVQAFKSIGGKHWGKVGMFGIITCCFILSFYIIVAGWALYYLYVYLFDYTLLQTAISSAEATGAPPIAGVGGFFGTFITSEIQVMLFSGLFMLTTIFIVTFEVKKGIEWVSKKFVPLMILLLVFLIISTPFIVGDRLNYDNFSFDFGALFSMDGSGRIGLVEAVGQSFFSLSLGACGMLTYGAHLSTKADIRTNSRYIVHTDTLVALLAAILIVPLFSSGSEMGMNPSLVFVSLVDAFNAFGPTVGRVIGIVFFALFNLAILTSTISLLEPSVNYFSQKKPETRKRNAFIFGAVVFGMSIPALASFNPNNASWITNFLGYGNAEDGTMGYFNFILDFFGTFCLIAGAFLLGIFIRNRWTVDGLIQELASGGNNIPARTRRFLHLTIKWFIPIIMVVLCTGEVIKVVYKLI